MVRLQRGAPHRPTHPRERRRDHGHRDRRRRDATPLVSGRPRPVRHAGLGARRRPRPRGPRRACRIRGARAAQRPGVPERRDDLDPRRRAARAADPRVRRPRHRARPHPRLGGGLRRHVVARPGPARFDEVRVGADEHHDRPDDPGRARIVRLRRRGHARQRRATRSATARGSASSPGGTRPPSPDSTTRAACEPTAGLDCRWCG